MEKAAYLSDDQLYRWYLIRTWDNTLPRCCFIMLNPSTADAYVDDPTIRRCIGFAEQWGYGGLIVVNLFAFRTDSPKLMKAFNGDPIGQYCDGFLLAAAQTSKLIICAWGNHGDFMHRDVTVLNILRAQSLKPYALRISKTGAPAHPLYLPGNLQPAAIS